MIENVTQTEGIFFTGYATCSAVCNKMFGLTRQNRIMNALNIVKVALFSKR